MKLRILNKTGISELVSYLAKLQNGSSEDPPIELLSEDLFSREEDVEIENMNFANRYEAAKYLYGVIQKLDAVLQFDTGLWSWIALFYFDQACPPSTDGTRKVGKDYRIILSRDYRHRYRHLFAGPYSIFRLHPDSAKVLLCGSVDKPGDFNEQLASRIDFIANDGIIKAVDTLYYDSLSKRPKVGSLATGRRPGALRRLISILQQLDLTYDLQGMSGEYILELLPEEFQAWRS